MSDIPFINSASFVPHHARWTNGRYASPSQGVHRGVDKVECSPAALRAAGPDESGVRQALVQRVRANIQSGLYDNARQVDTMLDQILSNSPLMDDLKR